MKTQEKPVGLTKDVGWQFGLRKTFPYPQEYLWDFMFSGKGLKIWLGELKEELEIKKAYKTNSGIEGLVRVFKPYSHIRMNWKSGDINESDFLTRLYSLYGQTIAKNRN